MSPLTCLCLSSLLLGGQWYLPPKVGVRVQLTRGKRLEQWLARGLWCHLFVRMTIVTDLELYCDYSFALLFYYFAIAVVILHLRLSGFGPLPAPL